MNLWGSGVLKVLQLVFNLLLLLLILLWRLTSIICCLIQLSHHTKLAGRCWMELLKGHFPDQGSRRDKDHNHRFNEEWCRGLSMPSESCKGKETVQFSHVWRLVQVLKGVQKPLAWVATLLGENYAHKGEFSRIYLCRVFLSITKKVNVEKII